MEHAAFWATDDLEMTEATRPQVADNALAIEEYPRGLKSCCAVEQGQGLKSCCAVEQGQGLKSCCAVEQGQARSERGERNHILLALRA
jgi:hypothetical protein